MKTFRFLVALTATIGMGMPCVSTAQTPFANLPSEVQVTGLIQDVALASNGTLPIQVVDAQGKPHAGTTITIRNAGNTRQRAVTGKDGQLVLPRCRPGLYEVVSGPRSGFYRVWAQGTAPPPASTGILLIDEGGVVRGSHRHNWQRATMIGGVLITAGAIGGVIGYNVKDDAS